MLAVGLLALALRGALPLDALSSWSERIVGVTLVGIGLWGFTRVLRGPIHSHLHVRAAAAVGVLHGVAGSSHFLGVLPALALPSAAASFGYLSGFALGTVAAMSGFAGGLGLIGGSDDAPGIAAGCSRRRPRSRSSSASSGSAGRSGTRQLHLQRPTPKELDRGKRHWEFEVGLGS